MNFTELPITNSRLFALNFTNYVVNTKAAYLLYKNNLANNLSKVEEMEMHALELLEKLGCNMDMAGTYMLMELIMAIIKYMEGYPIRREVLSKEELEEELENPFSQLYFDIARNELDLGIKTYHAAIQKMLSESEITDDLVSELPIKLENNEGVIDYARLALKIAEYLEEEKISKQNSSKLQRVIKVNKER